MLKSAARSWEGTRVRACIWCDAPIGDDAPLFGNLIECRSCRAYSTSPSPTDAALAHAYDRWYRPDVGRFFGPLDSVLRRTRSSLAQRLDRIAPPGPVLDVGSGDGTLLDALAAVGRKATGLELKSTRPDVLEADIERIEGEWAAVVFWHSLEHLRTPGAAIRHAASILAPGGVLIVAVPNMSSLQARAFGERWFGLDLPRHLVHLPAHTLLSTIEKNGLRLERTSSVRGGFVLFGWLHGLVGVLPGHPDLYATIRQPSAREHALSRSEQLFALAGAAVMLLPALAASAIEAILGRGGSTYVEARRV